MQGSKVWNKVPSKFNLITSKNKFETFIKYLLLSKSRVYLPLLFLHNKLILPKHKFIYISLRSYVSLLLHIYYVSKSVVYFLISIVCILCTLVNVYFFIAFLMISEYLRQIGHSLLFKLYICCHFLSVMAT